MKLLIAEKWQKSDTKLLENSSTAVLCWPQRKGNSTMTLGEKIASARKEKGMTQEMLAEQLRVTRQAVARWETGKALPGTANLFMLRELLGIRRKRLLWKKRQKQENQMYRKRQKRPEA